MVWLVAYIQPVRPETSEDESVTDSRVGTHKQTAKDRPRNLLLDLRWTSKEITGGFLVRDGCDPTNGETGMPPVGCSRPSCSVARRAVPLEAQR